MSIYKYRCKCGNEFKVLQIGDNGVDCQKCQKCGSSELEKSLTSSILPDSDNLENIRYPACISCTKQDCDTCERS